MWGALSGALRAQEEGRREAPPSMVACKRFGVAARWIQALIANRLFPLQRRVTHHTPTGLPLGPRSIQFDASPWGAGGVLFVSGVPSEFFCHAWGEPETSFFSATI
eukprot:8628930-Heterocapsa_arctica.AAC.1